MRDASPATARSEGSAVGDVYPKAVRGRRRASKRPPGEARVYTLRPENRFRLDPAFVRSYIGAQPDWGYGLLSYVTFKRTYARRVDKRQLADESVRYLGLSTAAASACALASTQTTEEYWQTCVRVVEGVSSVLKQHVRDTGQHWRDDKEQEHAQEMFRRVWGFKFTPPGRGFWGMGTDALEFKGSAVLNNCGFISTEFIDDDFADPFCTLMDYSMLGVGMGFDLLGSGKVTLQSPTRSVGPCVVADTREGWVEATRRVLDAYAGRGDLPSAWDFSKIRREGRPLETFGGTASGPGPLARLLRELESLCERQLGRPIDGPFIVDVMNLIGVCVVAGNVRRSSEIALGSPEDRAFLDMKNNEGLLRSYAAQREIAQGDPAWQKLQKRADRLVAERARKQLGPLDTEFAAYQAKLDRIALRQTKLLRANPAWVRIERQITAHPLMSHRWASNNTVMCEVAKTDYGPIAEHTLRNGEPGFAWPEVFRSYGRLADPPNERDRLAKGFNPCGEQTLHDGELCCLVETYPTVHESLEDFLVTLKYAYRYAKAVTLIPTHNKKTNAVMVRNRRIGTSMAGVAEMYSKLGLQKCIEWWDAGYREICKWDTEYSAWLGVNESIKKTSIKPGGTTPLMVGVEGGMKLPTSQYYMRTIRIDHESPIVKALIQAGYRVERDRAAQRTVVAYFPCKAPDNVRLATNTTLWEQAALFTALQRHWSDNMVSATLTFQPHEGGDLARLLGAYEGQWKCVSFLPASTHGFLQAPYIPCTREQYEAARSKLSPVRYDGLTIGHDTDDRFCSGGLCEASASKA